MTKEDDEHFESWTKCWIRDNLYIVYFIFTFILTKLEFGFYKSHIHGPFIPVKNTSPNKYN